MQSADDAANPAAGPPIDHRPALSVNGVAHRKHVLLREVNVEVAIRVRGVGNISVADSGFESGFVVEGFVGLCDFGQLLEFLPVPRPLDVLL